MKEEEEEEKTGESQQSQIDCCETPLSSSAVAFQTVLKHQWIFPQHLVCRFGNLANKNQGTKRGEEETIGLILRDSEGCRVMRGWRHLVSPPVYTHLISPFHKTHIIRGFSHADPDFSVLSA